jgi:sigma-E factor negative regulatory protein RseA
MDTRNMNQEQISALVDGEATDTETAQALAALRTESGRAQWAAYHRIGDALRSDDLDVHMSDDFMARMSARLAAEPTVMAPAAIAKPQAITPLKRYMLPGAAAAALVLAVVLSTGSSPTVQEQGGQVVAALPAGAGLSGSTPSNTNMMLASATSGPVTGNPNAAAPQRLQAVRQGQDVILRDPAIDQYLMAHQRVSPSFYSSAQYARSTPVASDSEK